MYILVFMFAALLSGCGNKDNGAIEISEEKAADVSVSEMLLVDKAPEESSVHKEFLKQFKSDRVQFGFDQFAVSLQDKEYLQKVAEYLMINLDLRIEVQGNCDKRGALAYNIALGEKRANSIADFLKKHGIAEHRITVVSFGSRILIEGDTDDVYSQNRVGIIVIK